MKDRYRLTAGNGLPLAGLGGLAGAARSRVSPSTLLSSKMMFGILATAASIAALLVVLRRKESEPEEKEPDLPGESTAPVAVEAQVPSTAVIKATRPSEEPAPRETQSRKDPAPTETSSGPSLWDRLVNTIKGKPSIKDSGVSKEPSRDQTSQERTKPTVRLEDSPVAMKRFETLVSRGNFSAEELEQLKSIAAGSLTTSASIGSQMPEHVQSEIVAAATRYGLDPTEMLRVASLESGGNPNAVSSTGAVGVFQFTSGTASDFGLANRFDYKANIDAGMRLTLRSRKSLKNAGLGAKADTALAAYIAHQIGAQGAKEVLKASPRTKISRLSKGTQRNIRRNIGGSSETVGGYLKANDEALRRTYDQQVASKKPAESTGSSKETAPKSVAQAASPPQLTASGSSTPPKQAPQQVFSSAPVSGSPSSPGKALSYGGSSPSKTASAPSSPEPSGSKVASAAPLEVDSSFTPKEDRPDQVASASPSFKVDELSEPEDNFPHGKNPQSLIKLDNGLLVHYG